MVYIYVILPSAVLAFYPYKFNLPGVGRFGTSEYRLEPLPPSILTLLTGGTVFVVSKDQVPSPNLARKILRY